MDSLSSLSQQVEIMYGRLSELYRNVSSPAVSSKLLPVALKELGIASEKLQVAMRELARQNEQLMSAHAQIETERQRYQHLFEFAPDSYLITDSAGNIREVNRAAAALLNVQPSQLIDRTLLSLIAFEDRSRFQAKLAQLAQCSRIELCLRLQRHQAEVFHAELTVDALQSQEDEAVLRWVIYDVTERRRAAAALEKSDYNPCHDRPLRYFSKGDLIPLEPQAIWLISSGVVKLTTLSDRGEEMLIGIANETMVFGASLTALQTYQATALTDVRIALISLSEIPQSPSLSQALLPMMTQRLRQTESFLSIYGQIRVEDRFNRLLMLLKQEIGQSINNGVRLQVRLTHQDFASACCTTRVTITRLLGKLQQQGKIAVDAQNHLIVRM